MRRLPLPSERRRLLVWAGVVAVCVVCVAIGLRVAWRYRAATAGEVSEVEALARDTGSSSVWRVYEQEARGGLTVKGAEHVREAAKAAPIPYGLLSDRADP